MASPCTVLSEACDVKEARELTGIAAAEAWRIEAKFSRFRSDNIIGRINSAGGSPVEVDAETAQMLDFAALLHELSDGRFDITSGVLREAWRFDGSDAVPERKLVETLMARIGWQRLSWNSPVLILPAGMEIDLGGIGKEYAVDRAVSLLRERGDTSCLVNFGGDLAVTSKPTRRDYWSIGIEDFAGDNPHASLLRLAAGALATSGDARRYLEKGGRRYGHILDPTTGWPVLGAPRSVTVAADTCTQAGMLSTLAILRGEGAEAFLDAQAVRYWCYRDGED
jgi:thiamine biosynthesis lipoprotein